MKIDAPRPPWRDEYRHDLPALQQYAKEVTAWQRSPSDPFERADVAFRALVNAALSLGGGPSNQQFRQAPLGGEI